MKKLLTFVFAFWQLVSFGQGTQIVPIRRTAAPNDILYYASTIRNKAQYPLTTAGLAKFNYDASHGVFNLAVQCPCGETAIIPAGTRPPLVPPCVTSCVSAPNWSSSWYDYNGNVLTVRATGADQTLRIERADGQAFTLSNPDNVPINNNTFYDHATLAGNVYQWQVVFPNAPQLKLTYKRKSDNATYVKTFTPAVGANNVNLFTSGSGGGSSCNLLVNVNSPTVNCGGAATLTATASGTSASGGGVTYSWTGPNNFVASGASIVVATAQANGTAQYTVTASKGGCQASATATVTVVGCQTTQPSGGYYSYRNDTFDYPSWPAASTSNKFPTFENEYIKIQLALDNQTANSQTPGGGGAIWKLWNKQHNSEHTLLYNPNRYNGDDGPNPPPRVGSPNRIFWGQGLSDCLYKLPRPLYTDQNNGAVGPSHDIWLGLNPNECGDDRLNSGQLQEYNVAPDGQGFHNKTRPPIYGQDGFYLPVSAITMEKWVRLSGRAIKLNYQANFNQLTPAEYANERIVTKPHETPCLYVNGLDRFAWYDGDAPYSNGSLTQITAPKSKNNANGIGFNGGRPGGQFLSEPWIWVGGSDGYGIGLMLKHNYEAAYAYRGDGGFIPDNPHMGGSYATITASPQEILDHVMKYRHEAEVIVGTVDEVRQYVYNHSFRPDFTPKFKWNRSGREGWFLNSGDGNDMHTWDDGYNGITKDGWKVYFGNSYNAVVSSPALIWKANQTQKLYLRYAYSGNQTQWSMSFQRNAQKPNGQPDLGTGNVYRDEDAIRYRNGEGNAANQTVTFTVIPDGQPHVAEITVPGTWQGVINRISFRPHTNSVGQYNSGEYATFFWLNNTNSDPFP